MTKLTTEQQTILSFHNYMNCDCQLTEDMFLVAWDDCKNNVFRNDLIGQECSYDGKCLSRAKDNTCGISLECEYKNMFKEYK